MGMDMGNCASFWKPNGYCRTKTAREKCKIACGHCKITAGGYCKLGYGHTMCKYKGQQAGQPAAANMNQVVWNKELATIAQRWADQCVWDHDKFRGKMDGTQVGQNM